MSNTVYSKPNGRPMKKGVCQPFASNKSNFWAMRVGFLLGQGNSSPAVSRMLDDGTHPATIRGMARRANILPEKARETLVPVRMPSWQRDAIALHAMNRDLTLDQIIGQVLECALVHEDLYEAVTDGRYDKTEGI